MLLAKQTILKELLPIYDRPLIEHVVKEVIENLQPGLGGEIQLTGAISKLLSIEGLSAMKTDAEVYYGGNKYGYLSANLAVGMQASKSKAILNVLLNKLNDDNF
jgi:UTP--glucose-1-phosphate uridylyltransferase